MISEFEKAKVELQTAIAELDDARALWSKCVSDLHLAELNLRNAQRRLRDCYEVISDLRE